MKISSRGVLSFVLALNGVIAAPLNPRNVEVVTVTEVTTEVVRYTSTLWVDPAPASAPTPEYGPDIDEDHGNPNDDIPTTSSVSMPETFVTPSVSTPTSSLSVVPSSTLAYSPVETTQQTTTPTTTPTLTPAPTTPTPTTPPPTPLTTPTTTSTSTPPPPPPAVKVPTTEVPTTTPPVYVPTTPPVVPTTTTPVPPANTPTYGNPGGDSFETFIGNATFYTPEVGSCGQPNKEADFVVAISKILMEKTKTPNPNYNPNCGRKILCSYNGGPEVSVTVVDTCVSCDENHLDLSPTAFEALGATKPQGNVIIKWHWVS